MDASALNEVFDAPVRGLDELQLEIQALADPAAKSVGETTPQLMVANLDIRHAVDRGEAPAQCLCSAHAAPAAQ
jgi:hypothetical protein